MRANTPAVEPSWLTLRGPADEQARSTAGGLVADLARFLQRRPARPVRLVDVGAGTGAGAAWLRPQLSLPQQWRLIDHDPALLALAAPVVQGWAQPVVTDLAYLADLLADQPAEAVTCQALLDMLSTQDIHALLSPAISSRAAVLASLTVTGGVHLVPTHPADDLVTSTFNTHQRRADRLGPDASSFAADVLRRAGYTITEIATPWRLGPPQSALIDAWLGGRAAAAAEQAPGDSGRIGRWLADRRSAARQGRLAAVVDHVDLLGIPPGYADRD